jgi:Protein of unknown function (DUF3237)
MIYTHDGLTLIYNTPEAPALAGDQAENSDLAITAILKPASPSNAVTVRYRVNGGPIKEVHAVAGQTDYRQNTQCFHARFPHLLAGQSVDYGVIGSCAGREVADSESSRDFPHSFRITRPESFGAPPSEQKPEQKQDHASGNEEARRYELVGEFLARFTITIEAPQVAGPTPDGIRVTWNAARGDVKGPRLTAKVVQGADWMLIKTDGIARVDVGALLETFDGCMIVMNYSGLIELGEDGYQKFLTNNLHKTLRVWTTPRFSTGDQSYKWLNRRQCISIGEVSMDDLTYVYDVYELK